MNSELEYNEILSMVTHDLKSPITAIRGAFDLLELNDLTTDEKYEALKIGKKSSKTLLNLIENILIMSKLEAGKVSLNKRKIYNIYEHFKDIIHTFRFEAKIKNIEFHVKISKKLPKEVRWDIEKLHYHVFNNIISNALKFTPTDGTGKVYLEVDTLNKDKIVITVRDNGIGVPKSKHKTIFSKFETLDKTKKHKGVGLGLYNASLFVKEHDGFIHITKGIGDKGVGFRVELPVNCDD